MSTNVDFSVASKLKTIIEGIDPCPDKVMIVPAGAEKHRPTEAKDFWVTLAPINQTVNIETGNAFINTSRITITVCVEATETLEGVAEKITEAASQVVQSIIYSTLGGYARRSPKYSLDGYSGGDTINSIYYFSATFEFEKQVEQA